MIFFYIFHATNYALCYDINVCLSRKSYSGGETGGGEKKEGKGKGMEGGGGTLDRLTHFCYPGGGGFYYSFIYCIRCAVPTAWQGWVQFPRLRIACYSWYRGEGVVLQINLNFVWFNLAAYAWLFFVQTTITP